MVVGVECLCFAWLGDFGVPTFPYCSLIMLKVFLSYCLALVFAKVYRSEPTTQTPFFLFCRYNDTNDHFLFMNDRSFNYPTKGKSQNHREIDLIQYLNSMNG